MLCGHQLCCALLRGPDSAELAGMTSYVSLSAHGLLCSIKTEGVIDRVSQLFKGDRALILGFNTFLPDGWAKHSTHSKLTWLPCSYKIPESYADAQAAAHTKLTTVPRPRSLHPVPPGSSAQIAKPRKASTLWV